MSDFRPGEVVDIVIKGVRIDEQDADGIVTIVAERRDGGAGYFLMPPQAAVTRVAPPEWPPQPGDLWRDRHGSPWFAADVHDDTETDKPEIVMVLAYGDSRRTPDEFNQRGGPVVLVHREPVDAEIVDECDGIDCFHPDCTCKAAT